MGSSCRRLNRLFASQPFKRQVSEKRTKKTKNAYKLTRAYIRQQALGCLSLIFRGSSRFVALVAVATATSHSPAIQPTSRPAFAIRQFATGVVTSSSARLLSISPSSRRKPEKCNKASIFALSAFLSWKVSGNFALFLLYVSCKITVTTVIASASLYQVLSKFHHSFKVNFER